MTSKRKPLEMFLLNDNTLVIAGAHLTAEEAEAQFGEEFRKYDRVGEILFVRHGWLRYEKIAEDDMDFEDIEPGTSLWILYETKNRPRGVTRAATVVF